MKGKRFVIALLALTIVFGVNLGYFGSSTVWAETSVKQTTKSLNENSGSLSGVDLESNSESESEPESNPDVNTSGEIEYQWYRVIDESEILLEGETEETLNTKKYVFGTYHRRATTSGGVSCANEETFYLWPTVIAQPSIENHYAFELDVEKCEELGVELFYQWKLQNGVTQGKCTDCYLDNMPSGTYICQVTLIDEYEEIVIYSDPVKVKAYTIIYDANGYDIEIEAPDCYYYEGQIATLPEVLVTDEDMTFKGWSLEKDSSIVDIGPYEAVYVKADLILYAVCEEVQGSENGYLHPIYTTPQPGKLTTTIQPFAMQGWTYGEDPIIPIVRSNYGMVQLTYSDSIDGVYTQTVPTLPGTYYVKATVAEGNTYTSATTKTKFVISKAQYDMSGISFEDATVNVEDGPYSIKIAGELPVGADGVQLQVEYNLTELAEVGTYEIVATFIGSDNYETPEPMKATLTIRQSKLINGNQGEKNFVSIESSSGFTAGMTLNVEVKGADQEERELMIDYSAILSDEEAVSDVVEITLTYQGKEIQPSDIAEGTRLTIRIKIPEALKDNDEIRVAHVHSQDDVTYIVKGEQADIGTYIIDEDGCLVTVIDRLSEFAFIYRVTAKCRVHYFLMLELALLIAFVALCFAAKKNYLNALSVVGLLVFAVLTIGISFAGRCSTCTLFLIINGVAIVAAFVIFLLGGKKREAQKSKDSFDDQPSEGIELSDLYYDPNQADDEED